MSDVTADPKAARATRAAGRPGGDSDTMTALHFSDEALPTAPPTAEMRRFDDDNMPDVRRRAGQLAANAGMDPERVEDVVVAVSEAISNSVRHGGGSGRIACWSDGDRFFCEIHDRGQITDPHAGRHLPTLDSQGGRGLWLMNQLSDLVQVRLLDSGQVVRMHFSI